jgi:hypothetical protein
LRRPFLGGLLLVGVLSLGLIGCSSDGRGPETLSQSAKGYADAFLHGSASEVNSYRDPICGGSITDELLKSFRASLTSVLGSDLAGLSVRDAEIRNQVADRGEARVTFSSSNPALGDSWLQFRASGSKWIATECDRLPVGGSGGEAASTASG